MDLIGLSLGLRTLFGRWGVMELPAFPAMLPQGWLHPDCVSRAFAGEETNVFCLQFAAEALPGQRLEQRGTFSLTWMRLPFATPWMGRILELPGSLFPTMLPATAAELVGRPMEPSLLGESGCLWDLCFLGVRCGAVRVLSGLGGERLPQPVGVVTIDLEALVSVCLGYASTDPVPWGGTLPVNECLASRWYRSMAHGPGEGAGRALSSHWEILRQAMEARIAERSWLEAYQAGMMLWEWLATAGGSVPPAQRQSGERAIREGMKRVLALVPRPVPSATAGKAGKEGILR